MSVKKTAPLLPQEVSRKKSFLPFGFVMVVSTYSWPGCKAELLQRFTDDLSVKTCNGMIENFRAARVHSVC